MWPWEKTKKIEWWRQGGRPFPWKDGDYLLAEKAYEAYTAAFYANSKFTTVTHIPFNDLPVSSKEVWRKCAEHVARWTIMLDSGRGDL